MNASASKVAALWSYLLIEELIRNGITHFVISPGSRSTQLVAAIARHPKVTSTIHFDERGAAFFALGYARATGMPAALVCTSGTAVANYFPAVVESAMDEIPLIMLTADRPAELRGRGANQTIDQVGIFGKYVRWSHDLPAPDEKIDASAVLTLVDRAVSSACSLPRGPVQLNCQFREPFELGFSQDQIPPSLVNWNESGAVFSKTESKQSVLSSEDISELVQTIRSASRGLIVIGRLHSESERSAAVRLADSLRWPIVADVTSGLLFRDVGGLRLPYADLLCKRSFFANDYRPDLVLQLGGQLVSSRVQEMITNSSATHLMIHESPSVIDPLSSISRRYYCSIDHAEKAIRDLLDVKQVSQSTLSKSVESIQIDLRTKVDAREDCTDIGVARAIVELISDKSALFVASSMPIRLFNMFCVSNHTDLLVAANRGASGIDGTIATAVGFATGLDRATTLVIGDLAFLHDLNSLALVNQSPKGFVIVILNDNGGGIFGYLPIASESDIFEKYFITPHGLSFSSAAEQFGIAYRTCRDMQSFKTEYSDALSKGELIILEVPLNRNTNREVFRSI